MTTIKLRRGTAAQWASANPVLAAGEPAYATDTNILKIGDGAAPYLDLPGFVDQDALSAFATATTRAQPFVLTRNSPGGPGPYVIGTDSAGRVFYKGLNSGGIGVGRDLGGGLSYTGGMATPTGVTYDRCFQIITFKGKHILIAAPTGVTHFHLYTTPALALSADSGWAWTDRLDMGADANANGISTQLACDDDFAYAITYGDPAGGPRIYRSADGVTWELVLTIAAARHGHAIEADPYNPGHVWATFGDGVPYSVMRSTDHGATWQVLVESAAWQAVQISFHEDYVAFAHDNGSLTWAAWLRDEETMVVGSPSWHYNFAVPRGTRTVSGNDYTPGDNDHYSLNTFFGAVDPETGIYYAVANEGGAGDWNGIFAGKLGQPLSLIHRGLPAGGNLNNRIYFYDDLVLCGLWQFPRLTTI